MHITPLPVVEIRPNPRNPRGSIKPADVSDLARQIARDGLLSPLLVHQVGDKAYEVIAGHRRLAAIQSLGWAKVDCHLLEADAARDVEALLLSEQLSHLDLPPFGAAEHVKRLLERDGMTVKAVAEQLGRSPRWVEQRRALATLHPKARQQYERESGCLAHWTLEMLEAFAEYPAERQGELLEEKWWADRIHSMGDLARELARDQRLLKHAPFDIQDATLLPKVGACVGCPNHTHARPDLFGVDDPKRGDLKQATCLLGSCFQAKTQAHTARAVAAARKETPGILVVHGERRSMADLEPRAQVDGALDPYSYATVAKTTKGAKPAYVVDGKGAGKTIWVKPARAELADASREKPERKPLTNEERQLRLDERRAALEIERTREWVESGPYSELRASTVFALLAAFGVEDLWTAEQDPTPAGLKKTYLGVSEWDPENLVPLVWPGVRQRISRALVATGLKEDLERARWVAGILGIDLAAVRADVEREIPTPKVLQQTTGAEGAPAEKPTKRRAPKAAKGKAAPPARPKARRASGKAAAAGDRDTDE